MSEDTEAVWGVARALGSRDATTAGYVEEAEDHQDDRARRRKISKQELRDAMRGPFS